MRPMLATSTPTIPSGAAWIHEVKWDGMRILADVNGGTLRLTSRTERDVTVAFPELSGLVDEYADMLLDGEIVCLDAGKPSFGLLAERFHVTSARRALLLAERSPATLMTFDLLRLYGVDLLGRTWSDRRATLERLELDGPRWQTPPTFEDGRLLHAATREQGLEGIVSKRTSSLYRPGVRSPDWLKSPHRGSTSVVIGGWRPESTGTVRDRLGAVLVGTPGPEGLRFVGRVGAGLAGRAGDALRRTLAPLELAESPFAQPVPREDAAGARWVRPVLVADVESLGLGHQGRLRQPAFKRLRADLTPDDVEDLFGGGE
ncbi:non-homologous end-joining DNA ligase [Intrasporangium calvum]|uniref:DNA ligase (ATP) n=1 Tax=Intrasporangium calvum TaxID=53358 RepID=A0ABT5GDP5_9MICO|nr:non-homologous end-joining DNA ligase [Intrasporangium calvum]MDC5696389.1 non-homologous end-joining DNA ligase [Intrasporangium calvum]